MTTTIETTVTPRSEPEPALQPRTPSTLIDQAPLMVIGGSVGVIAGQLLGASVLVRIVMLALGAYLGRIVPSIIEDRATAARNRAIDKELSTVASLLAVTVKAGLGLDAAFETVAAETRGPLGEELAIVVDEIRVGKRRNDALHDFQRRVPTQDVRRLVQSLHHAEELGGSVYDTLNTLADDCRTRRFQQARAEAAKLPVKILFPVVFLIFPPMLVVLVGPAMVDIMDAL